MLFNGNEITAKLVKIDSNKVSYSENGTMKSINKNEVFRIILQNGEKLLIKKETIYLPIVYEDMIIYTDGSDMKVNIVSLENETITYQYDNTLKTTHPTLVQFVKYKDGRTIKGIDLIKYEDKVIMNTGDEYNSVKYKDMNNTHVVIQEKGKQTLTELPITDVFVVKLHTGEKKFPPKSIIPATNSKKAVAEAPPIIRAYTYYYSRNDKKIAVTVIDGEVTNLTEDDIEVPKSKYDEFDVIIQKSIKKSIEENSVKVANEKDYSERYIKWKQKLTEQLVNDQLIEND